MWKVIKLGTVSPRRLWVDGRGFKAKLNQRFRY